MALFWLQDDAGYRRWDESTGMKASVNIWSRKVEWRKVKSQNDVNLPVLGGEKREPELVLVLDIFQAVVRLLSVHEMEDSHIVYMVR